jgi:hypothetical protein
VPVIIMLILKMNIQMLRYVFLCQFIIRVPKPFKEILLFMLMEDVITIQTMTVFVMRYKKMDVQIKAHLIIPFQQLSMTPLV